MKIRGLTASEDTKENLGIETNIRFLAVKLQSEINDIVKIVLKDYDRDQENVDYALMYFLSKFEEDNFFLRKDYDFTIEKIKQNGDVYYEIVIDKKEKEE